MYELVTDVSEEPVALSELKNHLRLSPDATDEDALLGVLLTAARKAAEAYTGVLYGEQAWKISFPRFFTSFSFPVYPVTSVTEIAYKDESGEIGTVPEDAYELVGGEVYLKPGKTWPEAALYPRFPVAVSVQAGRAILPAPVRVAILMLAGHLYENREATMSSMGNGLMEIPLGIRFLLNTDRRIA